MDRNLNQSNANESFDASLNVSSGALCSSTPFKVPRATTRKAAKPKVFVRPVCDTCQVCGKEYRCHRSYLNHMRQHSIKDAASRFPSVSQIIEYCSSTVFEFVQRIICKPAFGEMGLKYKELLHDIVSNEDRIPVHPEWNQCFRIIHEAVTQDIGEHKILLPSVLLNTLVKNSENLLADVQVRRQLCELLEVCVVSDNDALHCFVADYTAMLGTEIFKYYSRCLRDNVPENIDVQVELDIEDKESIHYISGAVVRGFHDKAKSFPSNLRWCNISKLIVERLLESDTVPGPPDIVKGWTKSKNKGKLSFVSGLLFDFFVGLALILKKTTHNKLKVDPTLAIENVCNGCVVLLWDEAVGDGLNEKASYDLMCGMIRSFCTVYAAGKSKKLLNNIRKKKAEASLALRARVAPRPKT